MNPWNKSCSYKNMMKTEVQSKATFLRKIEFVILNIVLLTLVSITPSIAGLQGSFLYTLSDFTGTIPYSQTTVSVDRERNEVYVLFQNNIRVFNDAGMEIYRFGEDLDLGHILDVAVEKGGDILLLSYRDSKPSITRCNYRGEPSSLIEPKNLPARFSDFSANRMVYRDGVLYFASMLGMTIVTTDIDGSFRNGYDVLSLLGLDEKERGNVEIGGFSVDQAGNMLFTVPVMFKACILSPSGDLAWFGRPGGAPGRFNVVSGIVQDSKGNYLIVDKLKSVIMAFDTKYSFITQFGYRGSKKGGLISPDAIAIDGRDRIYVTQTVKKGVSVFGIVH